MINAGLKDITEDKIESNLPSHEFEEVEVLLEPDIREYTTEEDEHLSISKPGKSGALGSISDSSEEGEETQHIKDRSP